MDSLQVVPRELDDVGVSDILVQLFDEDHPFESGWSADHYQLELHMEYSSSGFRAPFDKVRWPERHLRPYFVFIHWQEHVDQQLVNLQEKAG